jgi:hypothetical protein
LSTVAQGGTVSGTVGDTTIATSQMPSHAHSVTENGVDVTVYDSNLAAGGPYGTVSRAANLGTGRALTIGLTGGSGSHGHNWSGNFSGSNHNHNFSGSATSNFSGSNHNHNFSGSGSSSFSGTAINLAVSYVDVIIATKD